MEAADMNEEYDFATICRCCRRSGLMLQPMFHSAGDHGIALHEMFTHCTAIPVQYNDGLPQNVCGECVRDVNNAYNFRKRYEDSDRFLREYVSRRKFSNDLVKVEAIDIKSELAFFDMGNGPQILQPETDSLHGDDDGSGNNQYDEDGEFAEAAFVSAELGDISSDEEQDGYSDSKMHVKLDRSRPRVKQLIAEEIDPDKLLAAKKAKMCFICSRTFTRNDHLNRHLKTHLGGPSEQINCTICSRAFTRKDHLKRHMKIHSKDFSCEFCDRKFSTLDYSEYKTHMAEEHPGKELLHVRKPRKRKEGTNAIDTREYVMEKGKTEAICRICDTNFDRIAELRNHLKIHIDPITFASVDIQTKPYLFDEGRVVDNFLENIIHRVYNWDVTRFYQIMEPDGEELGLSDSDSEPEEGEPAVEGIVRRQHTCTVCQQSFGRIKMIMEHIVDQHQPGELVNCSHCQRGFPNNDLLARHLKYQCENQDKKIFCPFCNERFMWQTSMNKHAQQRHKPTKPLLQRSDDEGKEKTHVCQICNKSFLHRQHLDRHMGIHIPEEKKFKCTECHKAFNRKDNLRTHMKIHFRDPADTVPKLDFLCTLCGRAFSKSSNLTVHMRRHTGERPYKCDFCDKGFPRSLDLQYHRRTHTGEKPCICKICGVGFTRSHKLIVHMRTHTGDRPYKCTYCDRAFAQSNDLTLHIRRHTGEKPYACGVCDERFIQGTALRSHQHAAGHYEGADGSQPPFTGTTRRGTKSTKRSRLNRNGSPKQHITSKTMEVMDMSTEYDLSKICRSCRKDYPQLQSIFHSFGNGGEITLHEMLTSCTQIQIHYNDGMPHNLCAVCVAEVNAAYKFRKRYEQSDIMLREYISRRKLEASNETDDSSSLIKVELFDIKPEITFIDADPLIGEKGCVATIKKLVETKRSDIEDQKNIDDLIEEINDEDDYGDSDAIVAEIVDNEDDGDSDYEENSLDDLIEELGDPVSGKRQTRSTQGKGYSRIKGGKFSCDSCDRVFTDKRGITNHVKQHVPKELRQCSICNRGFSTSYHLGRHMKGHENDTQCEHCERKFASVAYHEYKEHLALEHPGKEVLPSNFCRKSEKPERDRGLKLSVELLEEKEKMEAICRICDTTFDRIVELRNHLKIHGDPKSFVDVNIQTKPYLFEEGYVLENYIDYLVQQVCKWDVLRFYQIVQPDGEELELSDSDSEPEEGTEAPVGIVRRTHTCALCNQSFTRIRAILEHVRDQHSSEELLACRHCARGFPNTALLVRHLKQQCENHSKKFFCTFCNEKFMWQTSLNKHAQRKHKPTKPLREVADDPNDLESSKDKQHVCQVCNKGFQRLEHLDRHIKIHIPSEKKFECTQCHKKFNRKDNLRSHMKIHKKDPQLDNKQNHLCVYCGRGFSNSSNLIVHMRRHTGERPYKCDICDKGFPRSSDLQCHRRTHTGEKPCLCTICGKGFSRSNKLVRHMRIHTGARPYMCTYCDRAFTQSNDLTLHIRRHTGEKPYVCGVCNERFIQGTALKAHQRVTGHFDDGSNQPERFASISVNNPNRLGVNGPNAVRQSSSSATDGAPPKPVKAVKSRKKATSHPRSAQTQAAETPSLPVPTTASTAGSAPTSPLGDGSRPHLQNLSASTAPPHGYVPVPYLMQSYDLGSTGLFSQTFNQP
ncbi:zinc finger protein Xfin-like [Wyeomyia smithii]|uniref:zinc finger protein Xfin-like n=1 Tax=Wyeomyia smithii TaxID=174621 RepID=UPI002467D700|nr:zinc finger protein Xfin-like [Wyeomyia smithii]